MKCRTDVDNGTHALQRRFEHARIEPVARDRLDPVAPPLMDAVGPRQRSDRLAPVMQRGEDVTPGLTAGGGDQDHALNRRRSQSMEKSMWERPLSIAVWKSCA